MPRRAHTRRHVRRERCGTAHAASRSRSRVEAVRNRGRPLARRAGRRRRPVADSAGQGRQTAHSAHKRRPGEADNGRARLAVPRPVAGTRRKIVCVPPPHTAAAGRLGAALAAPPVRHAHVRDHARSAAGLEAAGA